jgi:hypothetical protein
MGQLIKMREYPNASYRDVTAPNADTLYTTGFFYVDKEPWVLSSPDMKGRYAFVIVFNAVPVSRLKPPIVTVRRVTFMRNLLFQFVRLLELARERGPRTTALALS